MVQYAKVNMKQPIASVIHILEKMEQRTFLHQRNQFSDMDIYPTVKLFWTFDYTLVSNCPNHLHHCQLFQLLFCSSTLTSWKSQFQQEHHLIQIFVSCSQHFIIKLENSYIPSAQSLGIFSSSSHLWIRLSYMYS